MGIVTGLLKAQTWERVGKSGRVGRKDDENDKKPAGCWHSLMGTCISSRSSSSVVITTAESGSLNNGSKEPPVPQTRTSTGSSNSESNPSTPKAGGELKVASQLLKFTFNELKSATRNFRPESILGEGGFGCVFKGWIEENGTAPVKPGTGLTVAVKALNHDGLQGHKEWVAEVNFLGQLHHPNLVKLIGYCIEDDQRLLVYEFMPRGSLENHLFRNVWWRNYGARAPNLQRFSIRILSQTCTSLGCERNWSVFEKIHSKKRTRLEFSRLNDLVYVHYNLRLWLKQVDRTPNVDAISLDNIDVLSKWRVESEMPTMEEAPAWIDEEPEQQQALEEQQGEEEQEDEEEWPEDIMEGDVQSSAQPSTLIDASTPADTSGHPLSDAGPSTVRGRPDKQPLIFSRKRPRGGGRR